MIIEGKALERYFEHIDLLIEFQKLFVYGEPNDKAIVIVGASFIEAILENILLEFFPEGVKEVKQLIGNQNQRIKLLYCLGFLEKVIKEDLEAISTIRNKFAHNMLASFEDKEISDRIKQFKWHKIYFMDNDLSAGSTNREIFQVEVNTIISHLSGLISIARGEKRKIKDSYNRKEVL